MSKPDWQAFLRLADEATAGPWWWQDGKESMTYGVCATVESELLGKSTKVLLQGNWNYPEQANSDERFAAAARTIAPLAVRRVIQLEAMMVDIINKIRGEGYSTWATMLEEALRGD